jgi:hypothetical protein
MVDGGAARSACRSRVARPATWGAAIEVPDERRNSASDVCQADAMSTPGANRSRQAPKFEKGPRRSEASVAPTVRTSPTRAGLTPQASTFELPAATT